MTEELVTLETAELLKEKGFKLRKYLKNVSTLHHCYKYLSVPPQSVAQKWIRETKNIHVLSTPKVVESYNKIGEVVKTEVEFYYWDIYVVGNNNHKHIIQNCFINQFNTYEEALEAGIFEALKLI